MQKYLDLGFEVSKIKPQANDFNDELISILYEEN